MGRRFASSGEEARTNQAKRYEEVEWRNRKKDLINKKGGEEDVEMSFEKKPKKKKTRLGKRKEGAGTMRRK